MNYYVFNYTNKNGEEKELKLRLSSADAMEIENIKKIPITQFLQDESIGMMITMLRYLRKFEDKNFSLGQAQQLFDELIDSGYSMRYILINVIYESLVVSGFFEKSEWEEMKKGFENIHEKAKKVLSDL